MSKNLFVFFSVVFFSYTLWGKTIIVDQTGNGNYIQINEAIRNSSDGDTIIVKAGIYVESVSIYTGVTIIGESPEVTAIVNSDYCVQFLNNFNNLGSTMINFTIKNNRNIAVLCGRFDVYYRNRKGTLRNCIIENCTGSNVIEVGYSSILDVENCIIRNNNTTDWNININQSNINIVNCIIHDNSNNESSGSIFRIESGNATIQNCIIVNNHGYIFEDFKKYVTNLYNCIWNSGVGTGLGEINQDPKFQNLAGFDYFLRTDSPCIDAGNPSPVYNDFDGTRNDMGIYGGSYSWRGASPIITNLEVTPQSLLQGGTINISATATIE